jgi:chlorophyll synthase
MLSAQVVVIGFLVAWDLQLHAAGVALLAIAQFVMMSRFLEDPVKHALWYSAFGVPLFVWGMMVSAFGIGSILSGGGA